MKEMLVVDSLERRLLILTACLNLDDESEEEFRELLGCGIDWDVVMFHGYSHGTIGLIYKHLKKLSEDIEIPGGILERLRNAYLKITASNMSHLSHYRQVAGTLAKAGVKAIVLKGAFLAENIYGDIGLRPLSDIDILVREDDWPEIRDVLESLGYKPAGKEFRTLPPKLTEYDVPSHVQYISPAGTLLEFQFDLFTLGIGMRDIEGVWERAGTGVVGDAEVGVLGGEDMLLHLAVHANRHGCAQLKWLVDIAETLRHGEDLSWDTLASVARKEKIMASVHSTLTHTERLLQRRILPLHALKRLEPRSYQKFLWSFVWPRKKLDEFQGRQEDAVCFYFYRLLSGWNIINFALMDRVRDKLIYQVRWVMPPLSWMSKTYNKPKSMSLLKYYPIRLLDRKLRKRKDHSLPASE